MIKKMLSMLVILGMVFFVQCTDDPVNPVQETYKAKGGGGGGNGGGPGGGGHTETAGNNLSFPAFIADGYAVSLIPPESFSFAVAYAGDYAELTQDEIDWLIANGPWYPQKTEGNLWQAEFSVVTVGVGEYFDIDYIDWGDAIEAVDPKIGRPYRLELVLYVDLDVPMVAYPMAELEYPSSKNELQGTNAPNEGVGTYLSNVASVASPNGEIVIQRTEGVDPSLLTWNAAEGVWDNAASPEPIAFSVENNVGGKLIFGASLKGWKPSELGDYRITFYLYNSDLNLSNAQIGNYNGITNSVDLVTETENNLPIVDNINNLTYVDVTVTTGGGGGGGH